MMIICDNCGKKIGDSDCRILAIVHIEAILDFRGTKKKIDLCQQCQNDIYNMIMDSEVQNIDREN